MNITEIEKSYDLLTSSKIDEAKAAKNDSLAKTIFLSDAALLLEIRRRRLLEVSTADTIKQVLAAIQ